MTIEELSKPVMELEIAVIIDAIRRECTGHAGVVNVIRRMAFELNQLKLARDARTMSKVKTIIVFSNLMVAAIDEHGNQIPELQESLLVVYIEKATKLGYDLRNKTIETSGLKFYVDENLRLIPIA